MQVARCFNGFTPGVDFPGRKHGLKWFCLQFWISINSSTLVWQLVLLQLGVYVHVHFATTNTNQTCQVSFPSCTQLSPCLQLQQMQLLFIYQVTLLKTKFKETMEAIRHFGRKKIRNPFAIPSIAFTYSMLFCIQIASSVTLCSEIPIFLGYFSEQRQHTLYRESK